MNAKIESNFTYHPPKEGQPEKYEKLRSESKDLAYLIDYLCPDSREKSLAMTKLEEVVFWANAAIARNEQEGLMSVIPCWKPGMSLEEERDVGYQERNLLALRYADGWYYDKDNDWPGWRRVLSLDNGRMCFHIPDEFSVGNLPEVEPCWDGHSTEEKWSRVLITRGICPKCNSILEEVLPDLNHYADNCPERRDKLWKCLNCYEYWAIKNA